MKCLLDGPLGQQFNPIVKKSYLVNLNSFVSTCIVAFLGQGRIMYQSLKYITEDRNIDLFPNSSDQWSMM